MPSSQLVLYQPLLVGLGAVVLGLIANTLLEWFKQTISSRHRRALLRRTLHVELGISLAALKGNLEQTESPPTRGQVAFMPVREVYPAYDRSLDSLGLLTREELKSVVEAYEYLRVWPELLILMGKIERIDGKLFAHVRSDSHDVFVRSIEDRYDRVNNAMKLIQINLR
jgi:hypothetical protein